MTKKSTKDNTITFKEAVEGTPEISKGYCKGLQALKSADKKSVKVRNSKKLNGSVDIDKNTLATHPDECRWDYAIGYNAKAYFVEVHPANSSNVKEMKDKKAWLLNWLKTNAPLLDNYPSGTPRLLWAATTSGVHIVKGSAEYRMAAQMKLLPQYPVVIG